ncbi:YiiD C-terminal domain-containing protein [Clostridium sp. WILCCON 0269]|uniref:YiiD C-terminal domain-containing protein n=1 Tax=Candidatus Clostridium eludens TaxID=3381663 RepID=A0ABW8SFA5_9CLOT
MNEYEFEQFLHQKIPITKEMRVSVIEFTPVKVRISAQLEPNLNHKGTAFGGSINSLMTVCGWAMVYANIKEIDDEAHIVVQKSNINYLSPIDKDFIAECTLDQITKELFFKTYNKHNKARIKLKVTCSDEQIMLAEYHGQYVAFR